MKEYHCGSCGSNTGVEEFTFKDLCLWRCKECRDLLQPIKNAMSQHARNNPDLYTNTVRDAWKYEMHHAKDADCDDRDEPPRRKPRYENEEEPNPDND